MGFYFTYDPNIKLHCLVLYQEGGAFDYRTTS